MKKFLTIFLVTFLLSSCINTKKEVSLFYYKQELDPLSSCQEEAFLPVKRLITPSNNIYFDTISILIDGTLNKEEIQQGFSTEFPNKDFKLLKADLDENGTLFLDFTVVPGFTSGGSMRTKVLSTQIEKTALQFPEVKEIKYLNEELFQP